MHFYTHIFKCVYVCVYTYICLYMYVFCLAVLTLMLIGQLYKRVGQITTPVEAHDLRFHIAGLVFIQLLDATYQVRTIRRCLNVDVVCKNQPLGIIEFHLTFNKFKYAVAGNIITGSMASNKRGQQIIH